MGKYEFLEIDPKRAGKEHLQGGSQTGQWYEARRPGPRIVANEPTVSSFGVYIKTREAQGEVEAGVTRFFKGVGELFKETAISVASGILAGAMVSFLPPVAAIGISLGVGAALSGRRSERIGTVTQIQENLKPLDLGLQDDTIRKLAEPHQGKVPDDGTLRKTIEDVLSEDRQANEDLAKAFIKLLPTINRAAAATKIEFSGPVQMLITGDPNTITAIFNGFLKEKR